MLDGLAAQTTRPDAVIVVDNASTDHTREVLDAAGTEPAAPGDPTATRTSAAPAASTSACEAAYEQGFDRIWLMDDDVVPGPRLPRRADGRQDEPTA